MEDIVKPMIPAVLHLCESLVVEGIEVDLKLGSTQ